MAERWPAEFAGGADPLALVERILGEATVDPPPGLRRPSAGGAAAAGGARHARRRRDQRLGRDLRAEPVEHRLRARALAFLGAQARPAGDLRRHDRARRHDRDADRAAGRAPGARRLRRLARRRAQRARRSRCSRAIRPTTRWRGRPRSWASGEAGAIAVESDERFRMRPGALRSEITAARARGQRPIAVVASAGTTPTGAFDPLEEIADICASEGLWLHVDAAHGGSAALSPALAPQLAGIGRADSVVWDLHKTLPFPALASLLAYARARDAYGAFAQQAEYLLAAATPGRRTWARVRSSARVLSSRSSPTSGSRPWAPMASGSTSSGSGRWARSSRNWCGRAATSSSRSSRSATSSASATASRGRGRGCPPGAHPRRRQRERPLLRGADQAARRHLAALRAHEPGDERDDLSAMLAALRAAA